MDTPAAIAAFVSGEGGIYPTGTWMIGSFETGSETPGRPLYKSYAVFPYPRLWGERVEYVSGHSWVVPARKRSAEAARRRSRASSASWPAHNFDWARTGHIPAFKAVLDDPRFKALPHRADIAPLADDRPAAAELRAAPERDRRASSARKRPPPSPGRRPFPTRFATPSGGSTSLLAQVD